jgi:hypothetical protein
MNEAKIRVFQSSILVKNRTLVEKAAKDRFAITGSVQNLPETPRSRNRPQIVDREPFSVRRQARRRWPGHARP